MMAVLVTGAAGFIGMHVAKILLQRGDTVLGVDNLNAYYDPTLKAARLNQLYVHPNFKFFKCDISNSEAIGDIFKNERPTHVINLAAQAGVRYSIENPSAYIQSNLVGFANILENCRNFEVQHLVYASSSSVYGSNTKMPFAVGDNVDHPVSLYAATKKSNELMAHSYSHLYGLPTTGLRYFTVYGPWGRPDMSPWLFTSAIVEGRSIDVFNNGQMKRDFTYIDDIAKGTVHVLDNVPTKHNGSMANLENPTAAQNAPYKIYNIGNSQPEELMIFIHTIEKALGVEAKKNFMPMQPGDVPATYADVQDLLTDVGFKPETSLDEGIAHWVKWYTEYHPTSF
jgi:UDP-glucuronate 4-epimerase